MKSIYNYDFFVNLHDKTVYSARRILGIVLEAIPPPDSVVDFGCGVGTWLSVIREMGVDEILGLDGPWVDQTLLQIAPTQFRSINFNESVRVERKYDLAITLEVAEHLIPESSDIFVDSLVDASDLILFSAAIPFQGGVNHINEQWPNYWAELFAARGYLAFDFIRKRIWDDNNIPWWYRQNVLFFVKAKSVKEYTLSGLHTDDCRLPMAVVHPELYLEKIAEMSSVKECWRLFIQAIRNWLKRKRHVSSTPMSKS